MSQEQSLIGKVLADDYQISEFLGRGGMGVVFVANQISLGRQVAIKIFRPYDINSEELRRFEREIEAMATLAHPNIVTIHNRGKFGDPHNFYYTMEYLEGGSLCDYLRKRGKFSPLKALRLIRPVVEAIAFAHEQGYIHRDIKPDNLLFTQNYRSLKVADFGIAKLKSSYSITQSRSMLGSFVYAAPEQMHWYEEGQEAFIELDSRTDQYSLGIVLYQMLSCHLPYQAHSFGSLMEAMTKPSEPISKYLDEKSAPAIEWLVNTMIAPAQKNRFRDDETLLAALDNVEMQISTAQGTIFPIASTSRNNFSDELSATEVEFIQNLETNDCASKTVAKKRTWGVLLGLFLLFAIVLFLSYNFRRDYATAKSPTQVTIDLQIHYDIVLPKSYPTLQLQLLSLDNDRQQPFNIQDGQKVYAGIYEIVVQLPGYKSPQANKIIDIGQREKYTLAIQLLAKPRKINGEIRDLITGKFKTPLFFSIDDKIVTEKLLVKPGSHTIFAQFAKYQSIRDTIVIPPGNRKFAYQTKLYPLREVTFIIDRYPYNSKNFPLQVIIDKQQLTPAHFHYSIEGRRVHGAIRVDANAQTIRFQAGCYYVTGALSQIYLLDELRHIDIDKLLAQLTSLTSTILLKKQLQHLWHNDRDKIQQMSSSTKDKLYNCLAKIVKPPPDNNDCGWKLRWLINQQECTQAKHFYTLKNTSTNIALTQRLQLWQSFLHKYPQGIFSLQAQQQEQYYTAVNRFAEFLQQSVQDCYLSVTEKRTIDNLRQKVQQKHIREIQQIVAIEIKRLNCGESLKQMLGK